LKTDKLYYFGACEVEIGETDVERIKHWKTDDQHNDDNARKEQNERQMAFRKLKIYSFPEG
jgi:hypothetical protein